MMAKTVKKQGLTAAELKEVATLEAKIEAEEKAEAAAPDTVRPPDFDVFAERTTDERVSEVFSAPEPGAVCGKPYEVARTETSPASTQACGLAAGHDGPCGPAVVEPETELETFLREARAIQGVYQLGNQVSPDELKSLVNRAVGLLSK